MCETLDEIHEDQLASIIAKMRKEKVKTKPIESIAQ
jgi:hypothetical protein